MIMLCNCFKINVKFMLNKYRKYVEMLPIKFLYALYHEGRPSQLVLFSTFHLKILINYVICSTDE